MRRPPSWSEHNAAAFQLDDVVEQYHLRAPYPSTLSPFLLDLTSPPTGAVLELGCGTGKVTRDLASHVGRVDAIDMSPAMIRKGRSLPGGNHSAIRWIEGRAEDADLDGPYCLAIAGASLHWMDWDVVLPRVARTLNPGAVLAIVVSAGEPPPWADRIHEITSRYSVIQNWESADLIALLESRGVYERISKTALPGEPYTQTVADYIDGWHATSGLARERMGQRQADAFDQEIRELVMPYARGDVLELAAGAEVDVGRPLALTAP